MIKCSVFYEILADRDISFFTGVPDSLLKDFCSYVSDHAPDNRHIIAANEGGAVALATGYYLATSQVGLVYMQNSGQGNSANPLTSLADPDVYGIPMLLMIGWRGEPGVKDEPQHVKQGKITLQMLQTLDIPYRILPDYHEEVANCLDYLICRMYEHKRPVAFVVKKDSFDSYKLQKIEKDISLLSRECAIQKIVDSLSLTDIVISTTGMISRELYEYRDILGDNHSRDFLTVGSMGHASQIAMGIALAKQSRQVFCLDGDGATLMHLGAMAIIGYRKLNNFKHIILNNAAHDSVGGQPTAGKDVSFTKIALACGYKSTWLARTQEELKSLLLQLRASQGPSLLEIRVKRGARQDLGRPKTTLHKNKSAFMEFLS